MPWVRPPLWSWSTCRQIPRGGTCMAQCGCRSPPSAHSSTTWWCVSRRNAHMSCFQGGRIMQHSVLINLDSKRSGPIEVDADGMAAVWLRADWRGRTEESSAVVSCSHWKAGASIIWARPARIVGRTQEMGRDAELDDPPSSGVMLSVINCS